MKFYDNIFLTTKKKKAIAFSKCRRVVLSIRFHLKYYQLEQETIPVGCIPTATGASTLGGIDLHIGSPGIPYPLDTLPPVYPNPKPYPLGMHYPPRMNLVQRIP